MTTPPRSRFSLLFGFLFTLACPLALSATELAGKWAAKFETQIGTQTYVYEFTVDGDAITGTADYDHPLGKGVVDLKNIKLEGAKISFSEPLNIPDAPPISITYSGKIEGNEMKLTRNVGEFATEKLTAKRE